MSDSDWKWYVTPAWAGSCMFRARKLAGSYKIKDVTTFIAGPGGQIGFQKWLPLAAKWCEPMTEADLDKVPAFPVNKDIAEKLDELWAFDRIVPAGNGGNLRSV